MIRAEPADAYGEYAASVPAFLPHLSRLRTRQPGLRGRRETDQPPQFDGPSGSWEPRLGSDSATPGYERGDPVSTEVYMQGATTSTSTEP